MAALLVALLLPQLWEWQLQDQNADLMAHNSAVVALCGHLVLEMCPRQPLPGVVHLLESCRVRTSRVGCVAPPPLAVGGSLQADTALGDF